MFITQTVINNLYRSKGETMSGLSFVQTVLIAIIVPFFVSRYTNAYDDFRSELIKVRRHFRLYSNIYSNFHSIDEINTDYHTKVIGAQESLRIMWADMESKYLLIPNEVRYILIRIGKLPEKKDLEPILYNLLAIHNSNIIYRSNEDKRRNGRVELVKRREQIDEVKNFINIYL